MKKLLLLIVILLGTGSAYAANKSLIIGGRVEHKLTSENQNPEVMQETMNPQTTAGIDVLEYCNKDGLEWQADCSVVVE